MYMTIQNSIYKENGHQERVTVEETTSSLTMARATPPAVPKAANACNALVTLMGNGQGLSSRARVKVKGEDTRLTFKKPHGQP